MSIEFHSGDAPPVGTPSFEPPVIDAAPETPAGPAPELLALGETFGGDFTGFSSVEDAQRAALLIAQSYAQAGSVPPPAQPPQNSQTSAPPAAAVEDEDFGDLDPKVVARLKRLDSDLKQTRAQAQQFQDRLAHDQQMLQQQQHKEILDRALATIDALADPRYGVAGNRSFTQDIARENLLRTADRIVAGMKSTGKSIPTIEKLVHMAVLAESGKLPTAKAAAAGGSANGAPPAPVSGGAKDHGLPPQQRRKTGTEVDSYLADKDYMDGARAIVNRGRR